MNISLPKALKSFVDKQLDERGFRTSGEYIRDLIRKESERIDLRTLSLEGATSGIAGPADDAYFESLKKRVHRRAKK